MQLPRQPLMPSPWRPLTGPPGRSKIPLCHFCSRAPPPPPHRGSDPGQDHRWARPFPCPLLVRVPPPRFFPRSQARDPCLRPCSPAVPPETNPKPLPGETHCCPLAPCWPCDASAPECGPDRRSGTSRGRVSALAACSPLPSPSEAPAASTHQPRFCPLPDVWGRGPSLPHPHPRRHIHL